MQNFQQVQINGTVICVVCEGKWTSSCHRGVQNKHSFFVIKYHRHINCHDMGFKISKFCNFDASLYHEHGKRKIECNWNVTFVHLS
jgi:hypothetical protein